MKPDFFDYPRVVSEVVFCSLMDPYANVPYRIEGSRPNYGLSFHISTETKHKFDSSRDFTIRTPHTLAFIPRFSHYETYTLKPGYSACINFQLLESPQIPLPKIPFHVTVSDPVRVERLITDAAKYWKQKKPGYQYECNACLQALLACLESELNHAYFPSSQSIPIEETKSYIDEHFASERINIAKLAEKAGISEVYFRKKFKEYTGMAPSQYIKKRRIEWAKELLVSSLFTIESVAVQSGFSDVSHFCHEFKRHTGLSPTEYRVAMLGR